MFVETAAVVGTLAALGASARWNWWRPQAGGVPILMYHKVGDPPPGSQLKKLWVSIPQFRRQMEYLKSRGYTPMTLREIGEKESRREPIPSSAVVITFDDGYKNNHGNAFPILKEFGYKAVVYLVVNAIEKDNFWHDPASETRIPMLSWQEAAEMQAYGIEIGSHTMNHPRLSNLAPEKAREELQLSKRAIGERLGLEPVSFAYPYGNGQDNPAIQAMAREAGYQTAVSVHSGKGDFQNARYCLKRIFVRGDDFDFDFHLNMTRGRSRL